MHFTTLATAMLMGVASAVDVQVVYVGWNPANNATGKKYWPENIQAAPGSMVQFQFWTGNHTVTQSTFDAPCAPMDPVMSQSGNGSVMTGGIKSGFQPVDASAPMGEIPTYSIMINDTSPLWFYCGQSTHCQGGMSMVINEKPDSGKTLDQYKTAAAAVAGDDGSWGDSGGDSSGGSEEGSEGGSESGSESGGEGDSTDTAPGPATGGAGNGSTTPGNITGSASGSGDPPEAMGSGLTIPSTLLLLSGAVLALV